MTDIGESIAVAAAKKLGDKCWYCMEEPPEQRTNDVEANPQTESNDDVEDPPENGAENDSSTLGTNLGSRPHWSINRPGDDANTEIVPGAHHLIPGNASLKKAMDEGLKHFMCMNGDYNLETDIGYDVNDSPNGVWLPGNYQVRPGCEDYTKKWSAYSTSFKNDYAVRAMKKANAQFHDAHTAYNHRVLNTLRKLKEIMLTPADDKCPVCGDKLERKTRPPYGLVSKLHFISLQHRQMLDGLTSRSSRKLQTIKNGYYTSSRVFSYFGISKPSRTKKR